MKTIISLLPISNIINYREFTIEMYQVKINMAFNLSLKRWMIDVDNTTLNKQAFNIVMNQGTDLLNAHGSLDLQALVLMNVTPEIGLEAGSDNVGTDLLLVYMDMDTYHEKILHDAIGGREVYRIN